MPNERCQLLLRLIINIEKIGDGLRLHNPLFQKKPEIDLNQQLPLLLLRRSHVATQGHSKAMQMGR